MLKIKGSEIQQMLTELSMMALGPYGVPGCVKRKTCRATRSRSPSFFAGRETLIRVRTTTPANHI